MSDIQKKHYPEIDSLKGWAIFLVLLGHSIILFPINLHEIPWCATSFAIIGCTHMPLFFLVSGMCYSYKSDYKGYIVKKFKRLMIPYFIFDMLETFVVAAAQGYVNHSGGSILGGIKAMFLYGGSYWFLYTLFVIFLIYPVIDKVMNKNKYLRIAFFAVFLALNILHPEIKLFEIGPALKYLFWFSIGVYLRRNYPLEKVLRTDKPKRYIYLKTAIVAVLWIGIFCAFKTKTDLMLSIKDFFVTSAGIVLSFLLIRTEWFNKLFARFGKYSLQLYLLNCFTLGASRTFICSILGVSSPLIIIAFNMLIDYFLAYLVIKYICEKIKPVKFAMGMV